MKWNRIEREGMFSMKKVKIIIGLTLLLITILFNNSVFCQEERADKQIRQFSTGKDKITFTIHDEENNEPLIGAEIYSFEQEKILATTDINGIAVTEKGLKENLEISYIGYFSLCFKLDDNNIDSVMLWLKPEPIYFWDGVVDFDTSKVSPIKKGKSDAKKDLVENKIQLLTNTDPTEEQLYFAKSHDFEFNIWAGDKHYREAYNEVVIEFLNKKFEENIAEELKRICWRNYQP